MKWVYETKGLARVGCQGEWGLGPGRACLFNLNVVPPLILFLFTTEAKIIGVLSLKDLFLLILLLSNWFYA